jgi:hypothetical protein
MRFYKVLAFSILFYGSETWNLTKRGERWISSAKMKFSGSVD